MDDLTSYYAPPIHHPYYQPAPPPPPPGTGLSTPVPVVQPQFVAYVPPIYPQSSHDQVRTLFVAGLPEDVKPREIYHLFREFPGYQSSNLRAPTSANNQPFAFATFADQQSAIMALHALHGMVFDLEKGSTLHIDLAKSNSRSKRGRADDERQGSEKRQKVLLLFRGAMILLVSHMEDTLFKSSLYTFLHAWALAGVGSFHMPGMSNSAYNTIGYPSTQSLGKFDGGSVNEAATKSSNTPCPTLFVANLGPTCTEEELMQVFSRCRGFLKLKMQSTYGAPVAFGRLSGILQSAFLDDFQSGAPDTASSTEALSHLQGTILYSSTSGERMRLEFAKSRMGMRSKKSR